MSTGPAERPLRLMVASTVYGYEDAVETICATLVGFGYDVKNSHIGTISTHPGRSNLDVCLAAVRDCDAFLGLIRPWYGSGIIGPRSITHDEMRTAVALNKPRWFPVHRHVTIARQLLKQFRFDPQGMPNPNFAYKRTAVLDDVRVLDMYEDVVQADRPLADRTGNWAQEFYELSQALRFLHTNFADVGRVRRIVDDMRSQATERGQA